MDENKDIINVKKSSIEADFPIGQKLSINGINCVVAKRGSCPNWYCMYSKRSSR